MLFLKQSHLRLSYLNKRMRFSAIFIMSYKIRYEQATKVKKKLAEMGFISMKHEEKNNLRDIALVLAREAQGIDTIFNLTVYNKNLVFV